MKRRGGAEKNSIQINKNSENEKGEEKGENEKKSFPGRFQCRDLFY